ncbi:MAG TPA: ABC transporter permease [candidate division Zixibacteria bacterium]|nr:ABC transporter permease [candidate division Zixibacteria bacterium]
MRAFFYALSQAISSFWRRSFVTFLSITTITIALVILGAFAIVTLNLRSTLGSLKRKVHLEFYLREGATKADASSFISKLKSEEGVESVEFVTAERSRIEFIEEYGDELLRGLPRNPFPPSVRVRLSQALTMGEAVTNLADKFGGEDIVAELSAPNKIAYRLAKLSSVFLILTIGWGIILLFASTVIITNTVRLAIAQRADSISIMQLVGASNGFIRMPFIFEGVLHGAFSGGLAWLIIWGLTEASSYILPGIIPLPMAIHIAIILLGGAFGGVGSLIALRKYLKY